MSATPPSLVDLVRSVVREVMADAERAPQFAYSVVSVDVIAQTCDLRPAQPSARGLPDLPAVPMLPGVAGVILEPAVGSLVRVAFLGGLPTEPRIVGYDQTTPDHVRLAVTTLLELGGTPGLPVARVGDQVQAGPYAGAVVTGSTKVFADG
jgi:hypothetical protein